MPIGQSKDRLLVFRNDCIGRHQQPDIACFGECRDAAGNVVNVANGSRNDFDTDRRRGRVENLKISCPSGGGSGTEQNKNAPMLSIGNPLFDHLVGARDGTRVASS
jgi:hypothetical protein